MVNNDIYTKELLKINALRGQELTLEIINELRNLYQEYQHKRDSFVIDENYYFDSDKRAQRNGYEFLMNQTKYTFFFMLREKNAFCSNGALRRLSLLLEKKLDKIEDLVTINNHAIVVSQNGSYRKKANIYDEYLKEIVSEEFIGKNNHENKSQEESLKELLVCKINHLLCDNCGGIEKKLLIDKGGFFYKDNNLHIYVSDNFHQIYNNYYGNGLIDMEILIEKNAEEYFAFEMIVRKGQIEFKKIESKIWRLLDTKKNDKTLYRTLESFAWKKNRRKL